MTLPKSETPSQTKGLPDNPDIAGADAALRRAAERARRNAAAKGSPIVIFENGRIVWQQVDDKDLRLPDPGTS